MVLVVDCGNTDAKFGVWGEDEKVPLHTWRILSSSEMDIEHWVYRIASELLERGVNVEDVERSVVSSVVPDLTRILVEVFYRVLGKVPIVLNVQAYPNLEVKVSNPQEVGSDLVANAVAAYDMFQQQCIVVDFGTALTFTSILEDGTLKGVAIAPGPQTAMKSLVSHTAQLPEVPIARPKSVLGSNTVEAIQAGVVLGGIGMVKYIVAEIKKILGEDTKVVATGGGVNILAELDDVFDEKDSNLTIRGLKLVARQVKSIKA